jgi:hypothetical protein
MNKMGFTSLFFCIFPAKGSLFPSFHSHILIKILIDLSLAQTNNQDADDEAECLFLFSYNTVSFGMLYPNGQ